MKHWKYWLVKHWFVIVLLSACVVFSGVLHAWNMTHFPYYENDEAIYFTQAWTVLTQGKLSPYTYWYDHAPFGWIVASGWIAVTGGLFTFGFSLNSARWLMFVVHLCSTFLLFWVAKKVTKSYFAVVLTLFFFSVSPIAIYFQRRFLLDNMMTFWILLGLFLILYARKRLWYFFASAVCVGLAAVSKENGIFFFPIFWVLAVLYGHPKQRIFIFLQWCAIAGMTISFYPLYALLKQELFPTGTLLGGSKEHVSLLQTLQQQTSRGSGLPFWKWNSDFQFNYRFWLLKDSLFVIAASISFVIQGVLGIFHKRSRVIFFLTLPMAAFLMSGKLVINFYIIPIIPFASLCIGYALSLIITPVYRVNKILGVLLFVVILGGLSYHYLQSTFLHSVFFDNDTVYQVQAINWVKANLDPKAHIAMDYYGNLDLTNSRFKGDPAFQNADWYWKVDFDPDTRYKKLANNFHNLQYVLVTPQLYKDVASYEYINPLTQQALENSVQIKYFGPLFKQENDMTAFVLSHPNGDWVSIYKQLSTEETLQYAWQSYRTHQVLLNGEVRAPSGSKTSSSDIGRTLLIAVLQNDQQTFAKVWNWTQQNMTLPENKLFAAQLGDSNTSSDADQLIAFALDQASKKWSSETYRNAARAIAQSIWNHEVVEINNRHYLVAGTWTAQANRPVYSLNLSHFVPLFYRSFAKIDNSHPWMQLRRDMYVTLDECSASTFETKNAAYLPPNWCDVTNKGQIVLAKEIDPHATDFSYEAYRVLWNISLEAVISQSPEATAYLKKVNTLSQDWQSKHMIFSQYDHQGKPLSSDGSLDQYVATFGYFITRGEQDTARAIYEKYVSPSFKHNQDSYYWSDGQNTFEQNWIWLNIWMFQGKLETISP